MRRSIATSFTTGNASQLAQQQLLKIKPLFTIVSVGDEVLSQALQAGLNDFEDAIQLFAAQSRPEIELLVTRNGKDFRISGLPIADPVAAVRMLGY